MIAGLRVTMNTIQPIARMRDATIAQSIEILLGRGNASVGDCVTTWRCVAPMITIITVYVLDVVHTTTRLVADDRGTVVVILIVVCVQPMFGYRRRRGNDLYDLATSKFAFVLQEVGVHRNWIDAVLAKKLSCRSGMGIVVDVVIIIIICIINIIVGVCIRSSCYAGCVHSFVVGALRWF